MQPKKILNLVTRSLADSKAIDIQVLEVRELTSITDYMVICSGTSERHVKSMANNLWAKAKDKGATVLGVEGEQEGEWILVDLGDVLAHIMLPRIRAFYCLEKLWSAPPAEQSGKSK